MREDSMFFVSLLQYIFNENIEKCSHHTALGRKPRNIEWNFS